MTPPTHADQGLASGQLLETWLARLLGTDSHSTPAQQALMAMIASHVPACETDGYGRITAVNQAFASLNGYHPGSMVGRHHRLLRSSSHPASFWRELWTTVASGRMWQGTLCNRRKDGSLCWIDCVILPVTDAQSRINRYLLIGFPIAIPATHPSVQSPDGSAIADPGNGGADGAPSQTLIDQLASKNALLNAILDHLPCGLSVFDKQLNLVADNARFREMLELSPTLLAQTGGNYQSIIEFEQHNRKLDPERAARLLKYAHQPKLHEEEMQRANGRVLDIHRAPMPGGGFISTYTDITLRKQAELRAAQAEEILTHAIDALDEAFVLFDDQDRLVLCNQRYRDMYPGATITEPGTTFEAILHYGIAHGMYVDAIGQEDQWLKERLRKHQAGDLEVIQELKNGTVVRVVERRTPSGHIAGFRVNVTDLEHARRQAEEASRTKSQFLATMSHEIRTPMNAVLGMLSLLQGTDLNTRQFDYLRKAEGAAQSLLRLLNDILDFSKIEAGKMTLESAPFSISAMMRELSVVLGANLGTKNVEILFQIDKSLPDTLFGDSLRLKQILTNLGGNAIKFTEKGEILIGIRVLRLDEQERSVHIEFSVRDTGIGIAPEHRQRIFDGFSQAETSTTRRFGGSGLGLAISNRLLQLMNSRIELDSVAGMGSNFHFSLTLPYTPQGPQASRQDELTQLHGLHVLIVDDNLVAQHVMRDIAEQLNWTADVVEGGPQALALLRQQQPVEQRHYDAIFVDWQMPDMDGWETCRKLRQVLAGRYSPMLFMVSDHGRDMLTRRLDIEQEIRLDGYLVKPVTPSSVLDVVVDARFSTRTTPTTPSKTGITASALRLLGMRILLVEDNKINQQIASELLARHGAVIAIADNGQIAVDMLREGSVNYDVILMDVQMPVLDGIHATQKIRKELGNTTIPIIAMTANAMDEDRRACAAAGMNDHVAKPYNIEQVIGTLLQHTRPSGSTVVADLSPPSASTTQPVDFPLTWGEFRLQSTLANLGGDARLMLRMLRDFAHALPQETPTLSDSLRNHRTAEAARQLHTLKGMARTMGAQTLSTVVIDCEASLAQSLPDSEHPTLLKNLQRAIDAASNDLQQLLPRIQRSLEGTPEFAPVDRRGLRMLFQKLHKLLEAQDMGALEVHAHLRDAYGGQLHESLFALDEAMANLDFASALTACRQLEQQCA